MVGKFEANRKLNSKRKIKIPPLLPRKRTKKSYQKNDIENTRKCEEIVKIFSDFRQINYCYL